MKQKLLLKVISRSVSGISTHSMLKKNAWYVLFCRKGPFNNYVDKNKKGGGVGQFKQSTLVHPRGDVSGCPRGQNFEKMANDYEKSRLGQNWST